MTRAERRQQKEEEDQAYLRREWEKWRKERCDELIAGPYAGDFLAILAFLDAMTLEDADGLVELIEQSPLRHADADTRFLILDCVSRGIIYLRERNGLYPFDDPLPNEELDAYQLIRRLLQ